MAKDVVKEIRRATRRKFSAEEKIRKEILPRIKKEIERLKEKLREFRLEEDESEPGKT